MHPRAWWKRPGAALATLAATAFGASFAVGHWLFPLGSIDRDEPMYTFAARLLRAGHLSLPASFSPYRPWASGVHGGHVVLKYTPVWPAVLAVGATFGSMRVGVAAVAAAAVVLTGMLGRELFGRWAEGLIAAAILVCSPLFLVQTGTFLSYLLQLVLDLAIVLLVLGALRRWPETGAAPRGAVVRLVGAGAVWGVAAFAREYDAVLIAVPLVVMAATRSRHAPRRLGAWIGWSALGAAAPLAALLAYNWTLLGSPFRNPYTITGKQDTILFGRRGVFASSTFTFTPHDAAVSFARNLTRFPGWTGGGLLIVVLAGVGLWRTRRRGAAIWGVAGIAATFAVGYALFWSPYSIVALWPGTRTLGPFYSLALLIPLTLFGAAGIATVYEHSRAATAVIVAVLLVITAVEIDMKIDRNLPLTRQYQATQRLIEGAHLGHAVLFMEDRGANGFETAAPFLENRPDLGEPVVYATEAGPGDLRVISALPNRTPFRLRSELRAGDDLLHPTRFAQRLFVRTGIAVALRVRIVNTVGAPTVTIQFSAGGVTRSRVLATDSRRGDSYTCAWAISAEPRSTASPSNSSATTLVLPASSGTAELEADFAAPGRTTQHYELQYPFAIAGGRTTVLTPGWGRYLFQYRTPVWLNQNVAPTLVEIP